MNKVEQKGFFAVFFAMQYFFLDIVLEYLVKQNRCHLKKQ